MQDLKERTIRGGTAKLFAQIANFLVRVVSLMILARLLGPADFGLVGMVTAFTGVLDLFRDFGLSSAAVQRATITDEQISTLFWINILVGVLLGLITLALAPAIAVFYHEPRLVGVAAVLAAGFVLNSMGVQHGALLQRQMRFTTLAVISTLGLILGTVIAVVGAKAGYGYWSLVAMIVTLPLVNTVGSWVTTGWIPGRPRRRAGVRSMMRFGGTLTFVGLVWYVASNFEKVLLGRFWGVDAVGIYGRAYQLVNIPTANLNSAAGEVAFSALSRLQDDPGRLRRYFLKGYSIVLAMTLPMTVACGLFADDVVVVLLGPKWKEAGPIFRLLAPTILVFAVVNPIGWLLNALGLIRRSLNMAMVIGPIMIAAYAIGLPHGPKGVAFAYSAVMLLWVIPAIAWGVHKTAISFRDMLSAVSWPLASTVVASAVAFGVRYAWGQGLHPFPRLVLECTVLLLVFLGMLLFVGGQKDFYFDLLRGLRGYSSSAAKSPA